MSYQIIIWLIPYSDATFSLCKSNINNRFYDRLDRHVTAVDSEVNPGFVAESRAKNVIVSGLSISSECDDKTVVKQLCEEELDIVPDIHNCRRLGRVMNGRYPQQSKLLNCYRQLRNYVVPRMLCCSVVVLPTLHVDSHSTVPIGCCCYWPRI